MSFQRRASAFDIARRAGARFLPEESTAGEDDDMGYTASGTYSPTIADNQGTTTLATPLAWTRCGNGPGPQAGDNVRVFGLLSASTVDPDTVAFGTFPAPFVMAVEAAHGDAQNYNQSITSAIVTPDIGTGLVAYAVGGLSTADSPQAITIGFDFRTLNAVD